MAKTVLITGASGGFGLEFAKIFAKNNFDLVLVARSGIKLNELASELTKQYRNKIFVYEKDLSNVNSVDEIYNDLKNKNINIDFLVNNAGFGDYGFFISTNWEKEWKMIELNIVSLTYFTKLFAKDMVERKYGRIMNLASTAAFQPGPLMAVYYATKAYVLSFSEAISNELKGTGVTITVLCPGPSESGFKDTAAASKSIMFNMRKLPTAKEVAEYGYKVMMKGKVVAVHGIINKLLTIIVRMMPKSLVRIVVRFLSSNVR